MNPEKRQAVLIGVMLAMMLIATGWFTLGMFDQRRAAAYAAQDLASCEQLARQIESLRDRSAMASEQGDTQVQENRLVEQINAAAKKADLNNQLAFDVEHRREVRVADTPYMRKPAVLITRGLTMPQLTALLHHLTYDSAYTAEKILLNTPAGDESSGRWDADITLTYLIYSPQTSQGQAR